MTVEEHLRILIGDLVVKIALVTAENDSLKAQLTAPRVSKKATLDLPKTGGKVSSEH